MKKLICTTLALLAVLNFAHAQTLKEVLDKHFKAVGQEKIIAVKSYHMKAKVNQMGMDMPMDLKVKKPDLFIMTVDVQGQKMVQAFDGQKGWQIAPWVGPDPQELAGEQLAQAKAQANLEGDLYNYEQKGSTVELIGKITAESKDMYRVKLTSKDGNVKDIFIDAQSNLITKVKATVSAMGQSVELEQNMGDFKTIDGITLPMKVEQKTPMGSGQVLFEEIKFNEDFDDAIFKQPGK